jgi:hypothetical protein
MDASIEKTGDVRLQAKSEEWEQLGFFTGTFVNSENNSTFYEESNKTEGELYLEVVENTLEIGDIQPEKDITDSLFGDIEFIDKQSRAYDELNNAPQDFSNSFEL